MVPRIDVYHQVKLGAFKWYGFYATGNKPGFIHQAFRALDGVRVRVNSYDPGTLVRQKSRKFTVAVSDIQYFNAKQFWNNGLHNT